MSGASSSLPSKLNHARARTVTDLLRIIAELEPMCVNPADGAPFEDGEVPILDEARAVLRHYGITAEDQLRLGSTRFLDAMASPCAQASK